MGLDATLSAHHSPLLPTLPISVGGAPLTEGQGIRRSLESGPSPADAAWEVARIRSSQRRLRVTAFYCSSDPGWACLQWGGEKRVAPNRQTCQEVGNWSSMELGKCPLEASLRED